jgi:hypothetical protein
LLRERRLCANQARQIDTTQPLPEEQAIVGPSAAASPSVPASSAASARKKSIVLIVGKDSGGRLFL